MLELKVDGFSGPLDLLLDLIEREQLDITALSLAQVADQYWQHVESNGGLEPDALADFILIGSRLLYIKSCALLPSASPPKEEPLRDEGDVAAELARMVDEYKRFRDAAEILGELEEKIGELSLALERTGGRLAFRKLLAACETRTEIVVLFLAVLEMIKGDRLWAEQRRPFGEITLVETRPELVEGAAPGPA